MRQHAEFLPEFEVPKFLEEIPIEECIEEIEFASKKRVFRAPARSRNLGLSPARPPWPKNKGDRRTFLRKTKRAILYSSKVVYLP